MKRSLLASGVLLALCGSAFAAESDALEKRLEEQENRIRQLEARQSSRGGLSASDVRVSGYINAVGGATNQGTKIDDPATPFANEADPVYQGFDGDPTFTSLSSAGLQVDARINDRVSGTVQFFSDGSEDFDTKVEWAYITYRPTSSVSLRAGQLVLPLYMHSQYQTVGYAYNWISLPQEVYATAPVRTLQGVDITWQFSTGDVAHSLNLAVGNQTLDQTIVVPVTYEVNRSANLNLTSTVGDFTLWLGASTASIDLPLPNLPIITGNPLLPDFSPYSMEDDEGLFTSVGIQYDNGALVFNAERVELDFETDWAATNVGQYALLGYRFGRFLPSVTWASVTDDGYDDIAADPIAADLYNSIASRQKSWTFGVRADLDGGVALKAEVMTFYDLGNSEQVGASTQTNSLWGANTPDQDDDPMVFKVAAQMVF